MLGRPRGSYTKFKKTLKFLVPLPPRCICGARDYRYRLYRGIVWAICCKCGYKRYYIPWESSQGRGVWGPAPIPDKAE